MSLADAQLLKALDESHYLPGKKLDAAKKLAKAERRSLHDTLIRHDFLSEDELGKVAALHYQLPYVALGKVSIPYGLLHLLPEAVAKQYQCLPFELDHKNILHIATAQPDRKDLFDMLAKKAGANDYQLSFATATSVNSAMHMFKQELQGVFDGWLERAESAAPPVAELIDLLFEYAFDAKASDIHIEPLREQSVVRFRIDGVLHDEVFFPKALHSQIVSRLKVLGHLRTDEHLSAQDGRLTVMVRGNEIVVRISVVPLISGEKIAMRLLAQNSLSLSLGDLGMSQADLKIVKEGFKRPFGMVLSTGPTGAGKTTTIYSILKILNTRDRNIATIEDPVEYQLEGPNQVQVNPKSNLTFANGLRSLLRQDPDVLFVGEIRDQETASIAVNAAMTGHLVLSTMHTNDAVTTLPRLIDMNIEPYLAASTVNVIVGQRLVRQICEHCKASVKLTKTVKGWSGDSEQAAMLEDINPTLLAKHFGSKTDIRTYVGKGCSACHDTGYQGRIGIFEVLEISPKLAQLISDRADAGKLAEQAQKDGLITMLDDGLAKVSSGETTLSEIIRVTKV